MAVGSSNRASKQMLLTKLRNRGNYLHNTEVLRSGKGELSVVYRPSHHLETSGSDFVPCSHCLGSYRDSSSGVM